jgi:hypothetical protein
VRKARGSGTSKPPSGEKHLLSNEEWDEVPFADLIVERRPHQREGGSVTDDMAEIQRVKTVLMRQTLDNLYWQNNQQPIVQKQCGRASSTSNLSGPGDTSESSMDCDLFHPAA